MMLKSTATLKAEPERATAALVPLNPNICSLAREEWAKLIVDNNNNKSYCFVSVVNNSESCSAVNT
jgi:hypothetical protein